MPNQNIRFGNNATSSSVPFSLTGIGLIKILHPSGVGCGLKIICNKVKQCDNFGKTYRIPNLLDRDHQTINSLEKNIEVVYKRLELTKKIKNFY